MFLLRAVLNILVRNASPRGPMCFRCLIEPAVAMHLPLWYDVFVCHQYDVCENSVGSVYVGGYGGLSESRLCVFCKLCPVCFHVVGKGQSVLL